MTQDTPLRLTRRARGGCRALLVIERIELARNISFALNHGVFLTRTADGIDQALAVLRDWTPQIALIDFALDDGRLLSRLAEISARSSRIPVIALAPRGNLKLQLAAYERGVDDVVMLPFGAEELLVRTVAVMQRLYPNEIIFTPTIRLGELEIDIQNRRVQIGELEVVISSIQQDLLYLLAGNAGHTLSKEQITDALYGIDHNPGSNIIEHHVAGLRSALDDDSRDPKYIETISGQGYRFRRQDTIRPDDG